MEDRYEFAGQEKSLERFLEETDTAALLVIHQGRIVHESYRLTGGTDVRWLSMSVAKSFISALIGIAVQEGHIRSIDDPISAYVPVEPGSAYDGVAIRSVLQMSSGARWNEDYSDPEADALRLAAATSGAYGGHEGIVATMVRENAPDTVCRYNSCDTQALASLLRHATGEHLADYMQTRLAEPLGFNHSGAWVVDPAGVEMGYAGLNLTARDFATLGELYLNKGAVGSQQVVPREWVDASVTPSAPHVVPGNVVVGGMVVSEGYGYQWWIPAGDRGEFSAVGVYNQYVYVDPTSEVTTVKLSANRTFGTAEDEAVNRHDETIAMLRAVARQFD
ncbi:hypothetical protein NLS1_06310 [Nocardioides sp. LS1]|nr:hypothetical protein NLS1_06310 [Nocardioides sp. LS1]